ncbi:hypothetical protein BGX33_001399 [Mortierella sp. NVP41]|nr:hypothetical protein BGX33_001399 [Mortierella sp. NVP41]
MPMAPLRLATTPSGLPAWSLSTPCHSADTLLSPATTLSPTDPSNFKSIHHNHNQTYYSQNYSKQAHHHGQQWQQNKLSPRLAHPHPQQQQQHQQRPLASQLEYFRQLQIMHCQRERDIEQLYRQHQILQQQQQDRPPSHAIQRGLLAQRMIQLQRLFQAQQIQRMQAMHKLGRAAPSSPSPSPSPSSQNNNNGNGNSSNGLLGTAPEFGSGVQPPTESRVETGLAKTPEDDPNTIHLPTTASFKRTSVPELAKIVLPSPAQIRKQRQQRLKYQARLRQAASAAAAKASTTATATAAAAATMSMLVSPPASPSPYSTPEFPPTTTITSLATTTTSPKESTIAASVQAVAVPKVQPAVWTSSTTSLVPRSKADLQYRRQLRHRLVIQQHLIQDHTHRYRLFQAFCLLQRAQAAQAMEEVQTQRQRQLHTVAWVQSLREFQSKELLEIPQ